VTKLPHTKTRRSFPVFACEFHQGLKPACKPYSSRSHRAEPRSKLLPICDVHTGGQISIEIELGQHHHTIAEASVGARPAHQPPSRARVIFSKTAGLVTFHQPS
jgi:hypothetical protein